MVGKLSLAEAARLAGRIKAGESVVTAPREAVEIQPVARARGASRGGGS